MSTEETAPILVDSMEALQLFLSDLIANVICPNPKFLYLDLEGSNLCRHGSVSIVTLYIDNGSAYANPIYLIDIHTLDSSAFTTILKTAPLNDEQPKTLKEILESPIITKVFFDVRNDSDALFSHFGVKLQGVMDLQLMENASRLGDKRWVYGLAKCIKEDPGLSRNESAHWEAVKAKGQQLFAPEQGGSYEIFKKRPLAKEIEAYCAQCVICMPSLYRMYSSKLDIRSSGGGQWDREIRSKSDDRLNISRSQRYEPHGQDKALAPSWGNLVQSGRDTTWRDFDQSDFDNNYNDNYEYDFDGEEELFRDSASDYISWEEDMIKNRSLFR